MSAKSVIEKIHLSKQIFTTSLLVLCTTVSPLLLAYPAHAVTFTNDYPDMDATNANNVCSNPFGIYSWCKEENGIQGYQDGEQKSSRNFDYLNCVDGAAYWVKQYTGVTIPGSWGSAVNWDTAATGYNVKDGTDTNSIEPGDIAQSEDGGSGHGHVGFVISVSKDSNGAVTSFVTAELNHSGNGEYGGDYTYSSKNSGGKFIRSGSYDWDHFIDVNGVNLGLGNESITTNPTAPPDIRMPISGDFNGDGYEDLLASSKRSDPAPNLLTFASTGTWLGGSSLWSTPSEIRWADAKLTTGDLDNDGKSDLFAIQSQSDGHPNIYWLKSQGNSFASPQLVGIPGIWFNDVKEWASGDFNGDGAADLLAVGKRSDTAPNLIVFSSTGSWLGGDSLWGAPGALNWATVKVVPADLDGDGKTDLLSIQPDANGNPNIYWSRSTGSSFESPQLVGVPGLNFNDVRWVGGDFDGNGYDDLLASSKRSDSAPNLLVFPSTGTWLGANSLWAAPSQISWASAKYVPADLDGDGRTDLLAIQSNGSNNPNIYWIKSNGDGFATPQLVGVPGLIFNDVNWQI